MKQQIVLYFFVLSKGQKNSRQDGDIEGGRHLTKEEGNLHRQKVMYEEER